MRFCSSCGHELGVGRFCTNCGQPIDRSASAPVPQVPLAPPLPDASETAERRAARRDAAMAPGPARTPPSADDTPVPPRFPMYADEVEPDDWGSTATDLPPVSAELTGAPTHPVRLAEGGLLDRFGRVDDERTPRPAPAVHDITPDDDPPSRWRLWLTVLLLVVVVAAVLVWVSTRDDDTDGGPSTATDPTGAATAASLTADVAVEVPGTAGPSRETDGGKATFVATNMLDGDPSTAWRVAGDARGKEVTFTFPEEVTISQVGLVNGYAKTARGKDGKRFDWYHGNRTIQKVAWVFDDKTLLSQDLTRNRAMQTLDVDDITTLTLTLRLVEVSAPGTGRARRDFTAISDVTLAGTPAS